MPTSRASAAVTAHLRPWIFCECRQPAQQPQNLLGTPDVLGADFFAGQRVEISGVISHPPPPLAEGLFDFQNYLATRGIYYQLKTESTNDWKLLEIGRASCRERA